MTKHSLAYSLLALGPYVFASSNKRWVELQSFSFVWWVCCVDHSLFQIIFVCLHRSRLPLNAKPLWNLSAYMSVALLNEVPTNPPCALELKIWPSTSFAEVPLFVVCVCVCAFSFLFWFLRSNPPLNCLIMSSGMGLTCDGTLRIQSHCNQELQACRANTASLQSHWCWVK